MKKEKIKDFLKSLLASVLTLLIIIGFIIFSEYVFGTAKVYRGDIPGYMVEIIESERALSHDRRLVTLYLLNDTTFYTFLDLGADGSWDRLITNSDTLGASGYLYNIYNIQGEKFQYRTIDTTKIIEHSLPSLKLSYFYELAEKRDEAMVRCFNSQHLVKN